MDEIVKDITRCYEPVKNVPLIPWRIMASHSVPWPKTYRQWRSDGRLILCVNRGAIHDLPIRDAAPAHGYLYDNFTSMYEITIPVEFYRRKGMMEKPYTKPDLSLYIGRVVTRVEVHPEDDSEWWIELEGGIRIANKSPQETMRPDDSLLGARFMMITMSFQDTTLKFEAANGYVWSVSFKPTYYVIHDPEHGGEVYPQWPEEMEAAGIPATPEGGISDPPSESWTERHEKLRFSQEARVQSEASEFLKEDE